jgi:hypothetical protein
LSLFDAIHAVSAGRSAGAGQELRSIGGCSLIANIIYFELNRGPVISSGMQIRLSAWIHWLLCVILVVVFDVESPALRWSGGVHLPFCARDRPGPVFYIRPLLP